MSLLIAGLVIFLGVHATSIVAPGWRDAMVARMGKMPWRAVYSIVSLVGFVLIIKGYAAARLDPTILYVSPSWMRTVAFVLLLPVFPLLLAAYLPGRIKTLARHPMLLAVKLWALAHLLVNGTLADLLLFGGFLAWAVADRVSVKRRNAPSPPALPLKAFNDGIVIVGGLLLYVVFAKWLHPMLIGMPVMG